jgi:CheY-like chemotaxis protein
MALRCLIVDDSTPFQQAATSLLEREGLAVVGVASSVAEALRQAARAAWVPVPGAEVNPQQFWISVLDALRGTTAGARLVRELAAAPDLDGWAVLERLLADLGSLDEPLWLVIDDVHDVRIQRRGAAAHGHEPVRQRRQHGHHKPDRYNYGGAPSPPSGAGWNGRERGQAPNASRPGPTQGLHRRAMAAPALSSAKECSRTVSVISRLARSSDADQRLRVCG